MDITASDKRKPVQSIRLSDNITLKSWGAIHIKLGNSDFFPSSFCIENENAALYIDPVLIEPSKPADYIFITHAHPDHFSLADIKKISDNNTVIVCPEKVARKLSGYMVIEAHPQDTMKLSGLDCEVVPAYSKGFPSHPKGSKNVGYVLTVDGIRIYHSGDTDVVPELSALDNIDVALVPIDGGNLTMSTNEAADLINRMNPRIAIPMHYMVEKDKAIEFKNLVNKDIEVKIMAD